MNIQDYARGISFRFIQPLSRLPRGYFRVEGMLRWLGVHFDHVNTRLPDQHATSRIIKPLLGIPRMSTAANGAVVNRIVSAMDPGHAFVNVGVWHGFTFLAGLKSHADRQCVGIDNFSQFGGPREAFMSRFKRSRSPSHRFYDMDYREYFAKKHDGEIGFYIYDGNHTYEDQLEGLRVAEPYFSSDCVVMVDDTNYVPARQATTDFVAKSNNRYAVLFDQQTARNQHPTFWNGLMLLQRT